MLVFIARVGSARVARSGQFSEPTTSRKGPEKRLLEVLAAHYDELDRLLAVRADGGPTGAGEDVSQ